MKTKNKHTLLYTLISVFSILALAIVIVPPMITLNFLKQKIETVILNKTGVQAQITGNINFSMIGKTTIVAHDLIIPNGTIKTCSFDIPMTDLFNLKNAEITGDLVINGAALTINQVTPFDIATPITIKDSNIKFLNKEYKIIHADLSKTNSVIIARTDQHKYEIKSSGKYFTIQNKNNDLFMSGQLFKDGTATAHIDITAQNINRWFEFKNPKITGSFPISADLTWNGGYGVKFDNISANGVYGSIEIEDNGYKIIKLKSDNANFDMSFFMKDPALLRNASFDLNFYGDMTFVHKKISHLKLDTTGFDKYIKINHIIADDIHISGGTVDSDGAHDVYVSGTLSGLHTTCLFNGTPTNWYCKEYSHGNNITSVFSVKDDVIDADVYSTAIYADMKPFVVTIRKLASSGEVRFYYPDMVGTLHLRKDGYTVDYTRLDDKSLNQANINQKFLPDFMKNEPGDFVWLNGIMIFTPNSKQWQLSKSTDSFILRGNNFKDLTHKIDLQSLNDLPYVLSGSYKNGNISNLSLEIAGQTFTGSMINNQITLKTDKFDIDAFISKDFIANYERLSFFKSHPLTIPFETNVNIALSAKELIYQNKKYDNFVYSLKPDVQTFSISDSDRGNILASIQKNNIKYKIVIQLNKFLLSRPIFKNIMPLNISDSTITGDIQLNTYGKIAHDILDNLNGTFDITFIGGKLYGIGIDNFYASAPNIRTLDIENALSDALSYGTSHLKKLHLVGTYKTGDIKTTKPFELLLKHTDAYGNLDITDNEMNVKLKLILRGTSAGPEPIDLTVYPNGSREYVLSEIMMHFDPDYMRAFVKSHNQF